SARLFFCHSSSMKTSCTGALLSLRAASTTDRAITYLRMTYIFGVSVLLLAIQPETTGSGCLGAMSSPIPRAHDVKNRIGLNSWNYQSDNVRSLLIASV